MKHLRREFGGRGLVITLEGQRFAIGQFLNLRKDVVDKTGDVSELDKQLE